MKPDIDRVKRAIDALEDHEQGVKDLITKIAVSLGVKPDDDQSIVLHNIELAVNALLRKKSCYCNALI